MTNQLIESINQMIKDSEKIIIQTHANPDGDAVGSSWGLYYVLKEYYPFKTIQIIGQKMDLDLGASYDEVPDEAFPESLVIIVDTCADQMLADHRYAQAQNLICFDHHRNKPSLLRPGLFMVESDFTSCCAFLTMLLTNLEYTIKPQSATYLYLGLITDSGRFLYINQDNALLTFMAAQILVQAGADVSLIYDTINVKPLANRLLESKFSAFEISDKNVAYRFITAEYLAECQATFDYASRGTVNNMANIKEIPIWANFTENASHQVVCEARSRGITILPVLVAHGGGGHHQACGATLKDWDEAHTVITELGELINE